MPSEDEERLPWESEFLTRVKNVLPSILGPGQFMNESISYEDVQADLIYLGRNGEIWIVDVKATLPSTRARIFASIAQLRAYRQELENSSIGLLSQPSLVLVAGGALSSYNVELLNRLGDIRVILEDELATYEGRSQPLRRHSYADNLRRMLASVPPGRTNGAHLRYQRLVQNILEYLLCPPLNKSLYESSDSQGHNRRDMIFPNYVNEGFWLYMRQVYEAHYVVVDAKNYSGKVKKNDVLQISNYLNHHGTGLFGIITTRFDDDPGSLRTRRDRWVIDHKLLIVLNDADLVQMLKLKESENDPALLIRQKIEDFRIAL